MLENQKLIFIKDLGTMYPKTSSKKKRRYGLYMCPRCKKEFKSLSENVIKQNTSHCLPCATHFKKVKHGCCGTKLYGVFKTMTQRCNNKNNKQYEDYGGRGVTVCDEWINNYESFRDWSMSNGYKEGLSIDRENNNKGYSSDNCRWVTQNIQARNTRAIRKNNTSGYRGVYFNKLNNKWYSKIMVDYNSFNLGTFDYPFTAAYAYDSYVIKHNLEHTRNFK